MVKRSKGTLSGRTRSLKGKSRVTVVKAVRSFDVGAKVIITPKANHKGLPHLRYANRHGIVVGKRGKSYLVEIQDGKKMKTVIVGPIHLQKAS